MHTNTALTSPHESAIFFFDKGASPSFLALPNIPHQVVQRDLPSDIKSCPPGGQTIDVRKDPSPFDHRGGNPTNK